MSRLRDRAVSLTPSILPNSSRSLQSRPQNVQNLPDVIEVRNDETSWNVLDSWEASEEMQVPSQGDSCQNQDINDDVICLNEQDEDIQSDTPNGGGFVVNGTVELDYNSFSADLDMNTVESDDDIIYEPPLDYDDSIVFVDIKQDQGLIPRVYTGYIKEFINDNPNRLGILFSRECGLVLFHSHHVWLDGIKMSNTPSEMGCLVPGTEVSFYHYQIEDHTYRNIISSDGVLHQAAAVWIGKRPPHLLKETDTENHQDEMKKFREEFMKLLKERKFLHMGIVRGRGTVEGYINSKVGIIKTEDGRSSNHCRVLFHTTDIYLFGKSIHDGKENPENAVPVGLRLCFDARAVYSDLSDDSITKEVSYQACAVFAGSWPAVPHPTILPGGPGSYAPCYESSGIDDGTYYYLQLSLRPNLDRKWRDFCDSMLHIPRQAHNDKSVFRYNINEVSIGNQEEYRDWRNYFAPESILRRDKRRLENRQFGRQPLKRKKENFHYFKPPSERKWKLKKEEHDDDGSI